MTGINKTLRIHRVAQSRKIARPLIVSRVSAGFPSPAEDYIEGRIDLNRELIKHPLSTFYIRVTGDSMCNAGIYPNTLLVVDRAMETGDGHIVIARLGDELCVKRLSVGDDGRVRLLPENDFYSPIEIGEETDFEIWGRVIYSIQTH
ncbi:MAG: translesion error-prone DNA polymerase V autoproteolytic subunit [Pyrinomonadaceae bacterium]